MKKITKEWIVYAVEVRYPGFSITEKKAKECVGILVNLRKFIRSYFKSLR